MSGSALQFENVVTAAELYRRQQRSQAERPEWGAAILRGRIVELSGHHGRAQLTVAMGLVAELQAAGEPVAWVAIGEECFYPPDALRSGIDLGALPVVRVARADQGGKAADRLLRSGAFGMVVIDLGQGRELAGPLVSRLRRLADEADAILVCLTQKADGKPTLDPVVSLRAAARRRRARADEAGEGFGPRFVCSVEALRDRKGRPSWSGEEVCGGPPGLR